MLFLALAYHRQTYGYLQRLGELERAYEDLEEFDSGSADERFTAYVRRSIIEATDLNADSNDRRAAYLYRARVALLVVVAVTGILGMFYVVDRSKQPVKIPVVHIDNLDPKGKP